MGLTNLTRVKVGSRSPTPDGARSGLRVARTEGYITPKRVQSKLFLFGKTHFNFKQIAILRWLEAVISTGGCCRFRD
jgi:hypothetical protein